VAGINLLYTVRKISCILLEVFFKVSRHFVVYDAQQYCSLKLTTTVQFKIN